MVKSYFLTYGAQDVEVHELGQRIGSLLDMKVEFRSSFYIGEYVKCIGPQADRLIIEPLLEGDEETIKYDDFSQYAVFVQISNTKGKNLDKEARHTSMKKIMATLPKLVLVNETVLETKD